jgi:hypothetical protein
MAGSPPDGRGEEIRGAPGATRRAAGARRALSAAAFAQNSGGKCQTLVRNVRYLRQFGERPLGLYLPEVDIHLLRVRTIIPAVFVESKYYRYRILLESGETRHRAKGSAKRAKGGMVNAGIPRRAGNCGQLGIPGSTRR